mmetsp:Transcript_35339/g.64707  ORF Transcript_35339/g.64707 Transcript_35339/m.64707 type:complete len:935 (+) Transcript_35339:78-2882(+)
MSKLHDNLPSRFRSSPLEDADSFLGVGMKAMSWAQLDKRSQTKSRGISLDESVSQPYSSLPNKGFLSPAAGTPPELGRYFCMFQELDKKGAGKLTKAEAFPSFERMAKLTAVELAHIWQRSDIDKDGMLTFTEFAAAMQLVEKVKQGSGLPQQSSVESQPSKKTATEIGRFYSARQPSSAESAAIKTSALEVDKAQSARVPATPSLLSATQPGQQSQSARSPATAPRANLTGQSQSARAPAAPPATFPLGKAHSVRSSRAASSPGASPGVPLQMAVEYVSSKSSSPGPSSPNQELKKIKKTRAAVEELRAKLEASKEDGRRAEEAKQQAGSASIPLAAESKSKGGSAAVPARASPKSLRIAAASAAANSVSSPATMSPRQAMPYRMTSAYQFLGQASNQLQCAVQKAQAGNETGQTLYQLPSYQLPSSAQKPQAVREAGKSVYQPPGAAQRPYAVRETTGKSAVSEPLSPLQPSQVPREAQQNSEAVGETSGQMASQRGPGSRRVYSTHLQSPSLGSTPAATPKAASPNSVYRVVSQSQLQKTAINGANGQAPWVNSWEEQSPTTASTSASTDSYSKPPADRPPRPKMFRDVPSTAALFARAKREQQQAAENAVEEAVKPPDKLPAEALEEVPVVKREVPLMQEQASLAHHKSGEVSEAQVVAAMEILERLKHSLPEMLHSSQEEAKVRDLETAMPESEPLELLEPETPSQALQQAVAAPAPCCFQEMARLPEVTVPVMVAEGAPFQDGRAPLHVRSLRLATALSQHEAFQGWDRTYGSRLRMSVSDVICQGQLKVSPQEIIALMWRCKSRLDSYMKEDNAVATATSWTPTQTRWSRIWHIALSILQSDAWQEVVRLHFEHLQSRPAKRTQAPKLWQVTWEEEEADVLSFGQVQTVREGRESSSSVCVSPARIVRNMSSILNAINWNDLHNPVS